MKTQVVAALCFATLAACRTAGSDTATLSNVTVSGTQGVAYSSDNVHVRRATCMNMLNVPKGTTWQKLCNGQVTTRLVGEFRLNLKNTYESAFGRKEHEVATLDQLMATLAAPASTDAPQAVPALDKQGFAEAQLFGRLLDQAMGAAGGGAGDGSSALLRFDTPVTLTGRGFQTMDFALKDETPLQVLRVTLSAAGGSACPFAPLNIQAIDNGRLNEFANLTDGTWQFSGVVMATGLRFTWLGGSGACQLNVTPTPRTTATRRSA